MAFGLVAHQVDARRIRVLYDVPVTDTALVAGAYSLASLAAPGTSITPAVESVTFGDEVHRAVLLELSASLTTGVIYSVQAIGVAGENGQDASDAARNFTANVYDPPHILGAYLSTRGCVDLVFDRSVGPSSPAATAQIRDASGGPTVPMTLLVWASEQVLPESSVRFALPPGMPTANGYAIEFDGIEDASFNTVSGTTDLELALRAPLPYDYVRVTQLQLIDAYVADVSNDFLNVGKVRVYFNCPVGDANFTVNWSASIPGSHLLTDTLNLVTAPDAIDEPSFVTLMNDIKAKFNAHINNTDVHVKSDAKDRITSPNAVDMDSAIDILNEAQTRVLDHFASAGVHVYPDIYHTFTVLNVPHGSLGFAIAVANQDLKPAYNNHLATTYPVEFSGAYPLILGPQIHDRSHLSISTPIFPQVYPATSPYTYFTELHLIINSVNVPVFLTATLTSDDGGSVTDPLNYTGSITARAASAPAVILGSQTEVDRSVAVIMDREPVVEASASMELLRSDGTPLSPTSTKLLCTLPGLIWAFNQVVAAYSFHIDASPEYGAGHMNIDLMNVPIYITSPTVANACVVVNQFVDRFNSHVLNESVHFQADFDVVKGLHAVDMPTLVNLVAEIRAKFLSHNSKLGPHSFPGWRIVSARFYDTVVYGTDQMVDGEQYQFNASLRYTYRDNSVVSVPANGSAIPNGFINRFYGRDFFQPLPISTSVNGLAIRPSLASALPRPGIVDSPNGLKYESDLVEVFFSKPMYQVPLDHTNLVLAGGSILFKDAEWIDPRTVAIQVANMEAVNYSLQAVGLTDAAGNPVYP